MTESDEEETASRLQYDTKKHNLPMKDHVDGATKDKRLLETGTVGELEKRAKTSTKKFRPIAVL